MAAKQKDPAAQAEPGFDQKLASLEAIAAELERGELPLEAAIARYQQGIELVKKCQSELARHQQRVEELSREAERALAELETQPSGDEDAEDDEDQA